MECISDVSYWTRGRLGRLVIAGQSWISRRRGNCCAQRSRSGGNGIARDPAHFFEELVDMSTNLIPDDLLFNNSRSNVVVRSPARRQAPQPPLALSPEIQNETSTNDPSWSQSVPTTGSSGQSGIRHNLQPSDSGTLETINQIQGQQLRILNLHEQLSADCQFLTIRVNQLENRISENLEVLQRANEHRRERWGRERFYRDSRVREFDEEVEQRYFELKQQQQQQPQSQISADNESRHLLAGSQQLLQLEVNDQPRDFHHIEQQPESMLLSQLQQSLTNQITHEREIVIVQDQSQSDPDNIQHHQSSENVSQVENQSLQTVEQVAFGARVQPPRATKHTQPGYFKDTLSWKNNVTPKK
ncbi:unnamed protein product [Allacma fusca]|uniref:Uncharacterized protein n=1 Tax=Allacma fusca TaxID=39272 RepID=A0A8J2P999_9HEXA|nr:unnamed protein product [Allacma fusca]